MRRWSALWALALVAGACGGSGGSTTTGAVLFADPIDVDYVLVDEDPASPAVATLVFPANGSGLDRITLLDDATGSLTGMLVFQVGDTAASVLSYDSAGRLAAASAPDGSSVTVLRWDGDIATVRVIDADGGVYEVSGAVPTPTIPGAGAFGSRSDATVLAMGAVFGGRVAPVAEVTAVATGAVIVDTASAPGFNPRNAVLRIDGCTTSHPAVACSATTGGGVLRVQSSVDVAAVFGGNLPASVFATDSGCEQHSFMAQAILLATAAAGMGSMLGLQGLGAYLGGVGGLLGFGALSIGGGLLAVGAVSLAVILQRDGCTQTFSSNESITREVLDQVAGVTVDVRYTAAVIGTADATAVAEPASSTFGPFAGSVRTTAIGSVVVRVTSTQTTTTTTTTVAPGPSGFTATVGFTENAAGDPPFAMSSEATVSADFLSGAVSGNVSGIGSWTEEFGCFFDNDPSRPTGDIAVVTYDYEYGGSYGGSIAAAADGSFSVTLPFEPVGYVDSTLTQPFTAECAHLNGEPAPGIGPSSGSGSITVTVTSGGVATVATNWNRDDGAVNGQGSAGGSFG